jgi:hypothetical protein
MSTTQPLSFEAFDEIDELQVEPDWETVESLDAIRGLLFGIVLCVPFWAGVFWLVTSG